MTVEELNDVITRVAQPRTHEVFGWMLEYQEQFLSRADPDGMSLQDLNDLIASVAQPVHELKGTSVLFLMLEQHEDQDCAPYVGDSMFEQPNELIERLAA